MEVELIINPYENIKNYVQDGNVPKNNSQNMNLDSIDTDANGLKNSNQLEERKGNNQTILGSV